MSIELPKTNLFFDAQASIGTKLHSKKPKETRKVNGKTCVHQGGACLINKSYEELFVKEGDTCITGVCMQSQGCVRAIEMCKMIHHTFLPIF